jgi:predicted negative regulator of RcsB-dependent stress response
LFVDETAPLVQLHDARVTWESGWAILQIRWSALDTYLGPRPVELEYQRPPDLKWFPATPDPLANTGRFDWRMPDDLEGPMAVRLIVSDEGGHRVITPPYRLDVTRSAANEPGLGRNHIPTNKAPEFDRTDSAAAINSVTRQRADRLYNEGVALRDAGLNREAIARLRETVKLDPKRTDALLEMGALLYRLGDLDRALAAYEAALAQQPNLRGAVCGAAVVERDKKQYHAAAERLRALLRYSPADAEVWMKLGDIAVFQGDEILARECYTRASRIDPQATNVVAEARNRLHLMAAGGASAKRSEP